MFSLYYDHEEADANQIMDLLDKILSEKRINSEITLKEYAILKDFKKSWVSGQIPTYDAETQLIYCDLEGRLKTYTQDVVASCIKKGYIRHYYDNNFKEVYFNIDLNKILREFYSTLKFGEQDKYEYVRQFLVDEGLEVKKQTFRTLAEALEHYHNEVKVVNDEKKRGKLEHKVNLIGEKNVSIFDVVEMLSDFAIEQSRYNPLLEEEKEVAYADWPFPGRIIQFPEYGMYNYFFLHKRLGWDLDDFTALKEDEKKELYMFRARLLHIKKEYGEFITDMTDFLKTMVQFWGIFIAFYDFMIFPRGYEYIKDKNISNFYFNCFFNSFAISKQLAYFTVGFYLWFKETFLAKHPEMWTMHYFTAFSFFMDQLWPCPDPDWMKTHYHEHWCEFGYCHSFYNEDTHTIFEYDRHGNLSTRQAKIKERY